MKGYFEEWAVNKANNYFKKNPDPKGYAPTWNMAFIKPIHFRWIKRAHDDMKKRRDYIFKSWNIFNLNIDLLEDLTQNFELIDLIDNINVSEFEYTPRKRVFRSSEKAIMIEFTPLKMNHLITNERLKGETKIKGEWKTSIRMPIHDVMNQVDKNLVYEIWEEVEDYFALSPISMFSQKFSVKTWCKEHPIFYMELN